MPHFKEETCILKLFHFNYLAMLHHYPLKIKGHTHTYGS